MSNDVTTIGVGMDTREVREGTKDLGKLKTQSKKTKKATDLLIDSIKRYASFAVASAAIYKTIQIHREFTKTISELSAITGATGQDLGFLTDEAKRLGSTTTFTASQVAEAFKLVASAKPELLESKESLAAVTGEVLTLAEASGLTLPESAKALGGALNQFIAGADQASRFINVLAAGAKYGASEINDTSQALKVVGAVASSVGLSFEETNAAIQMMAAVSIKGSEAGTGLRGVLLKLAQQSNSEFNPEIVGLSTALENLKDANLTTTEKVKLFGLESVTAATALIEQADSADVLIGKLTGTATAAEQARTNVDNIDGDIKAMGSQWEGAALIVGEMFDPALRAVVKTMTWAGKVASSFSIALGDMGDAIGAFTAATASMLTLDFDGADAIMEARIAQRDANQKAIDDIWAEKDAVEQLAETKQKAAENEAAAAVAKAQRDAEAEERRIKAQDAEMERLLTQYEFDEAEQKRINDANLAEHDAAMDRLLDQYEFDELELERVRLKNEAKLQLEKNYWDQLYNLESGSQQAALDFVSDIRAADYKSALTHGATMLGTAARNNKTAFEMQKRLALANAVVTLPSAVLKSYENGGGYPWGLVPAGLMLAAGLQQINAIKSSSYQGGGGSLPAINSGSAGGSPGTAGGLPPGAITPPPPAEQDTTSTGAGGVTNITLNARDGDVVTGAMMDQVFDMFSDAVERGDKVFFSRNSAQAMELVGE